jgi:hypothetical protein
MELHSLKDLLVQLENYEFRETHVSCNLDIYSVYSAVINLSTIVMLKFNLQLRQFSNSSVHDTST